MVKIQNIIIWIHWNFIVHVKTGDIYKDIAEDVERKK